MSAVHIDALTPEDTDWSQIAALYGSLRGYINSPIVELDHAVAVSKVVNPAEGLAMLDSITELDDYTNFHVARANLLKESGDVIGALAAFEKAHEVATSEAQRRFLTKRLQELTQSSRPRTGPYACN